MRVPMSPCSGGTYETMELRSVGPWHTIMAASAWLQVHAVHVHAFQVS